MRSLFIVSLPRSLSSQVYDMACAALGLQSPTWTSAGEILNPDRSVLHGGGRGGLKFTTPRHVRDFAPAQDFLTQVVATDGFAYKDVVQPFVAARWLHDHPGARVLKIVPNIAHVAFAMLGRRWLYPTLAAPCGRDVEERMVAGLLRAAQALDGVAGESVAYDDLMQGFEPLRAALALLYPEREVGSLPTDPGFGATRDAVLRRRDDPLYRRLDHLARTMAEDVLAA